jgi:glucose-1-phosphate thymidylyltransferase
MTDCIILAAGYATRLYPLTRDTPKPLLPVAGKPIIDHLVEKATAVPDLGEIIVVTNRRFFSHFTAWRNAHPRAAAISIVDDGTTTNETRIGALADLALAAEHRRRNGTDARPASVLAGDNLFAFSLSEFVAFFRECGTDCITTHHQPDRARLQRTGVVEVDDAWRVIAFQEKPPEPRSTWAVPPFYAYTADTLREHLPQFLAAGHDADAPGSWIPGLIKPVPVHAFRFSEARYDIGNLESYAEVRRAFGEQVE